MSLSLLRWCGELGLLWLLKRKKGKLRIGKCVVVDEEVM
jgi:hypothetical protein